MKISRSMKIILTLMGRLYSLCFKILLQVIFQIGCSIKTYSKLCTELLDPIWSVHKSIWKKGNSICPRQRTKISFSNRTLWRVTNKKWQRYSETIEFPGLLCLGNTSQTFMWQTEKKFFGELNVIQKTHLP